MNFLIPLAIASMILTGCDVVPKEKVVEVTEVGKIDFEVESANVLLQKRFIGSDGKDYHINLASLDAFEKYELALISRNENCRCSVQKRLSGEERSELDSLVRLIRICDYKVPVGYPMPLTLPIPSGSVAGGGKVVRLQATNVSGLAVCSGTQIEELANLLIKFANQEPVVCDQ